MTTCTSCGNDVTGKKFCSECGTPVEPPTSTNTCPRCNGEVQPGAAFCIHCGSALNAQPEARPAQPLLRTCPACHTEVAPGNAFCTNCGHNFQASATPPPAAPVGVFCGNCGKQNDQGVHFCTACGTQLPTPVPQPPYGQPGQYPQQPQPYSQYPQQSQYGQMGYMPEPMLGQPPMVLRCPTCMAMSPMGTTHCPSCRTNLAGVVPTPGYIPGQGQQGGFMQGDGGKYAMGALGGAAAVIGGEMLLHEVEHHHEGEGLLGGLGDIANDIGLF